MERENIVLMQLLNFNMRRVTCVEMFICWKNCMGEKHSFILPTALVSLMAKIRCLPGFESSNNLTLNICLTTRQRKDVSSSAFLCLFTFYCTCPKLNVLIHLAWTKFSVLLGWEKLHNLIWPLSIWMFFINFVLNFCHWFKRLITQRRSQWDLVTNMLVLVGHHLSFNA